MCLAAVAVLFSAAIASAGLPVPSFPFFEATALSLFSAVLRIFSAALLCKI